MIALRLLPHIAALVGVVGIIGCIVALRADNATQAANIAALTLQIDGCAARNDNILQDKESDNEIDNRPNDALRDIPAGWMREPD